MPSLSGGGPHDPIATSLVYAPARFSSVAHMSQLPLSLRERGMTAATEHAGVEWKNAAYTFLLAYARNHAVFCGEDVSDAHIAAGLSQPPDLRAWGSLYRRAVADRVIARLDNDGWSKRRASPCPRYRSLVYGLARAA